MSVHRVVPSGLAGVALLCAACGGPDRPSAAPPRPEVTAASTEREAAPMPPERPTTATPTAPDAAGDRPPTTGGTRWTSANIDHLQPTLPAHRGRVEPPLPISDDIEATLARLGAIVDSETTDPDNPWAIVHGLIARGPTLVLRDGHVAVDWLFEHYGEEIDGHPGLLSLPESRGPIRIEPHTDLVLKSLIDAGVAPEHAVEVGAHPHRAVDLWRGSLLSAYLVPATNHSSYGSPDDIAWSLQGLAGWAPPGLSWTALDGTEMDLDGLTDFGVAVLYKETRFLADAAREGAAVQRRGQGIFHYTCGGAHLLQGVAYAVARGFGGEAAPSVVAEQVSLMQYRLAVEPELTRQAAAAMPEHADRLTVQRLKFAGHYLETMSKLLIYGFAGEGEAAAAARASLATAAQEVVDATAELERRGLLADPAAVRARDEQLYLDIVGDSAHALRGLELALGRGEATW